MLLDVSLDDGNGFAVYAAAKAMTDMPVIFLTASGDEYCYGFRRVFFRDSSILRGLFMDVRSSGKYFEKLHGAYPEGGAITIKAVDNNIYLGIIIENTGKGENQVEALAGVLFAVNQGEFVAIIGFSGSGKSTLLHILGGVDRPASGKVFVNDIDVYEQKEEQLAIFRRREVGLIYQFYNLISVLDVTENITLPVLMEGEK